MSIVSEAIETTPKPTLQQEMYRALHCLNLEVDPSIVLDVTKYVKAAFDAEVEKRKDLLAVAKTIKAEATFLDPTALGDDELMTMNISAGALRALRAAIAKATGAAHP